MGLAVQDSLRFLIQGCVRVHCEMPSYGLPWTLVDTANIYYHFISSVRGADHAKATKHSTTFARFYREHRAEKLTERGFIDFIDFICNVRSLSGWLPKLWNRGPMFQIPGFPIRFLNSWSVSVFVSVIFDAWLTETRSLRSTKGVKQNWTRPPEETARNARLQTNLFLKLITHETFMIWLARPCALSTEEACNHRPQICLKPFRLSLTLHVSHARCKDFNRPTSAGDLGRRELSFAKLLVCSLRVKGELIWSLCFFMQT